MKNCLAILQFIIFHFAITFAQAKVYYISANGSDNNNGLSTTTPFKSLSKVNTLVLKPGDAIKFKRGDLFRGQLNINQSGTLGAPILIDAYGKGQKPTLLGSIPVLNWKQIKPNIWETDCAGCSVSVTGLYINSKNMPLGRYPNIDQPGKGYLTVKEHIGKNQLISKERLDTDWTGGEAVIRTQDWVLDKALIISQNKNSLNLKNPGYEPRDNWGYFIQNHPATVDKYGEWCYQSKSKKLTLFYDKGNPNLQNIEVTACNMGIDIENHSFIIIQNMRIAQNLHCGIHIINTANLIIKNTDVFNSGEDGIVISETGDITIEHTVINNVNNNGVAITGATLPSPGYNNFIFKDNTITNIGLTPGMGKGGELKYFAFMYDNDTGAALVENNKLDSLGYVGIRFSGSHITIKRNLISNYNCVKSDGGGIYTWNGGNSPAIYSDQKIESNIILNSSGSTEGTGRQHSSSPGIYLDDCSENISVINNTVANCSGPGILLHGASNINITGNTCFNNHTQISLVPSITCLNQNVTMFNNFYIIKQPTQAIVFYMSPGNNFNNITEFSKNYYYSPFNNVTPITVNLSNKQYNLSLSDWKRQIGMDGNLVDGPITKESINSTAETNKMLLFRYNASNTPIKISLSGKYKDARLNIYSNSITLYPYTSVVLIKQ